MKPNNSPIWKWALFNTGYSVVSVFVFYQIQLLLFYFFPNPSMDIAFTVAIISVLTALFIPIYLTIRFHIRLRLKHIKLWQLSLRSGVLLSTALAITVYVRHVYFNPYLNSELDLNAIMFVTWVIMFTLLSALFILISNLLLKQKFKGIEFKSKEILDQTTHD